MTTYDTMAQFRADLLGAGVLVAASVDGLYGRSGTFEDVAQAIARTASRAGVDLGAQRYWFPPVMARNAYERTGYLRSFPDLGGSIDTFQGSDRDHAALLRTVESGGDWTQSLVPSEVVLCSAACHPLFELMTGRLPAGGRYVELQTQVFRHEPSPDPMRMQSFRQHEFVYLGDPAGAVAHRDRWVERGLDVLTSLGLRAEAVVANDPFFGRLGQLLAAGQRDEALKYELVVNVSTERSTAIASANCHLDHFGEPFEIRTADDSVAHTACVGFGLERIALAMFGAHGLDPNDWPADVRTTLETS